MLTKTNTESILQSAKERVKVSENPAHIEENLVAAILKELDYVDDTATFFNSFYKEIVKPIEFSINNRRLRVIWWALNQLKVLGQEINATSAIDFISAAKDNVFFDMFAGTGDCIKPKDTKGSSDKTITYIQTLYNSKVTKTADEYLEILKFAHANQIYHQKLKEIQRRLEMTGNQGNMISELSSLVNEYNKSTGTGYIQSSQNLAEVDKAHLADLLRHSSSEKHYVPTADKEVNKLLFGFPRGKLSLITGSSGHGKSLHTLRNAYHAFKQGFNVFYISLEMDEGDVIKYLIAIALNEPLDRITEITSEEELMSFVNRFYEQVEIDNKKGGSFTYDIAIEVEKEDLMHIINVHTEFLKLDLLCIDHFSKIQNPNANDVRGMFYFKFCQELISVAKHHNLALLGAVHYSNEAAKGENSRMYQEGISDSAHYRKEAGLILGVYRPKGDLAGLTYFSLQVLKSREQGKHFGQEWVYGVPYTSFTPIQSPIYKTISKVERAIKKQQERLENEDE